MREVSRDNFGLLIAYLVPGFVAVLSVKPYLGEGRAWFGIAGTGDPTVGGFLYGTVASLAAGMLLSAVRWAVVDRLYHATGIPEPRWNFGKLSHHLPAFEALVEYHYRYYQFYSNMLVALVFACGAALHRTGQLPVHGPVPTLALVLVLIVLVAGSRDALRKYYRRVGDLQ